MLPHGAPERQRRYTAGVEHNCIAPRAPTPQRHALHVALEHTYRRRHASWRCGVRRLSCLRCSSADASPAAQAESRAARSLPPAWPHTASLCAPGLGGNELAGGAGGAPLSQCCGLQPFPSQLCAPAACLQFKTIFTGQTLCNGQSKRFGSAETGAVRETPRINACRRAATAHNLFIRDWRAKRCCIEKWVVAWRGMSPVPLTARAKGEDLHRSSAPALQLVGSSIQPVTCPAVQLPS
jgi:hypothetical protein